MKFKHVFISFLIIAIAILGSCSIGGEGSITALKVVISDTSIVESRSLFASAGDIARILLTVTYTDSQEEIISNYALTENAVSGEWEGTVENVVTGFDVTIDADAQNIANETIFEGTTLVAVSAGGAIVEITLFPVAADVSLALPVIERISRPALIKEGDTAEVQARFSGISDEAYTYELTAPTGAGTFSLSDGVPGDAVLSDVITMGSSSYRLETFFTAGAPGAYVDFILKISNEAGYSVSNTFDIQIAELGSALIETIFSPVITGINITRTAGGLVWEAIVDAANDPVNLSFTWNFVDEDFNINFSDPAVNPALLADYNGNQGTVSVTVEDTLIGGSTTVEIFLVRDFFAPAPELIVEENPMSGVALFTNTSFVQYSTNYYSEAYTLEQSLLGLASAPEVTPFTEYDAAGLTTALDGKAAVAFPSFYDYGYPTLAADAITAIQNFVNDGGVLLKFDMTYQDWQFMNMLFSWSINDATYHYSSDTLNLNGTAAAGTVFETAASSLYAPNPQLAYVNKSQLPAGALSIYEPNWDPANWSGLLYIPYGSGYIVWFGNGWYNMLPIGSEDGGWLELLELALSLNN